MMFLVKFAGLILCLGILAFGGYKTVEGICIDEMIEDIEAVVAYTPLFPSAPLPEEDDPEDDPVDPPSEDENFGGGMGSGGGSSVIPTPNPSTGGNLSSDEVVDALGGLYDNHDPDFNEINRELFVGMVESAVNGNSADSDSPTEDDPYFDSSFDLNFDGSFDPNDPFVPEEDSDDDDDEHKADNIIIDVAGNYYENLQQSIQNNIESNRDASAEEQQAARDEFIQKESEAFTGLLNIATKPKETTEEQIVESVDAVLKSDVCLNTLTQTVSENGDLTDTVRDATEGMGESYKTEIKNKIDAALAENPEKAQQYNDLASLFDITLDSH